MRTMTIAIALPITITIYITISVSITISSQFTFPKYITSHNTKSHHVTFLKNGEPDGMTGRVAM